MKSIIVTDLGFGDSGKGTVTDSIVRRNQGASLVVRYNGGFQAAHNVHTDDGKHHTFSQFGSGTLAGASTLLNNGVIINPLSMDVEAEVLADLGIDAYSKMYVSPWCLITTPYHRALNNIREECRKVAHGSVGVGIGETVRQFKHNNELSLVANYLSSEYSYDRHAMIFRKLDKLREYMEGQCYEILHDYPELKGKQHIKDILAKFDGSYVNGLVERYIMWASKVHFARHYPLSRLLNEVDLVVLEGAQGVLLDQLHGFHPYTTWSNTTDQQAYQFLTEWRLDLTSSIGVMRTYMTRHGAGPFPSENGDKKLISDDDNTYGKYQGNLRVGDFDAALISYALSKCRITELAVTHYDKLTYSWPVVTGYDNFDLSASACTTEASREAFERTYQLMEASPLCEYVNSDFITYVQNKFSLPVALTSNGKTHKSKKYYGTTY